MQTKIKDLLKTLTDGERIEFEQDTMRELKDLLYIVQKHHPFYSAILAKMLKEIGYDIPVAAVTFKKGSPLLLVNPFGMNAYSSKEQIFIYIHEIMHIVNQHHLRGKDKDPGVFNIAADVSINQLIESAIAYRPADCLMPHHFDLQNGLSAEQYYDILIARDEPITLPEELQNTMLKDLLEGDEEEEGDQEGGQNGQGDQEGDGEGDGDGDGEGQGQGQGKPGNGKGKPGKGQGPGQPGQGQGKPGQGGGGGNKSKAPGFEKLHPNWKDVQAMSEEMVKGLTKGLVKEAMDRSAGNMPGELKEAISELFEPQVQWDRVLRSFASSLLSSRRRPTWSRPNRRFGEIKMGNLRKKQLNLMVAIDTSGSLTTSELVMFLSEIKSMKEKTDAKITIVQCDTHIHEVVDFDKIDIHNFEIKGRGGTDLVPPFELIKKRKLHGQELKEIVDGVIYLTDGEGPAPATQSIRTLWVLTPGGRIPYSREGSGYQEIEWGQSVFLNDGKEIKQK